MMKLDMSRTFPRRAYYFPKVLKEALCRAVPISFFGGVHSMDQGLLADLRGHRGTVTNVAFVACYPELLVTCSHDKSFKV